jgi:hypothetical protein
LQRTGAHQGARALKRTTADQRACALKRTGALQRTGTLKRTGTLQRAAAENRAIALLRTATIGLTTLKWAASSHRTVVGIRTIVRIGGALDGVTGSL